MSKYYYISGVKVIGVDTQKLEFAAYRGGVPDYETTATTQHSGKGHDIMNAIRYKYMYLTTNV